MEKMIDKRIILSMLVITLLILSGCLYKSQKQIEKENLLKEVGWNQTKYEEYSDFYVYLVHNTGGCPSYKGCENDNKNVSFKLEQKLNEIPRWKNEFENTWYLLFYNYQKGNEHTGESDKYFKIAYDSCQKIAGWNPSADKAQATKYKRNKTIIHVGSEQTYKTIQSAIDAAAKYDIILVDEGTYFENIVLKQPVLLIGKNKNSTIIDGKGTGNVVNLSQVTGVTISGFTIRNSGRNEKQDSGILTGSNRIIDNVIMNNAVGISIPSGGGSGIYNNVIVNNAVGISITLSSNTISGNDIESNYKYGIYILSANSNKIYNNTIKKNKVGISANGASFSDIYSNNFINNVKQAEDSSISNDWGGVRSGNYWSDYNGSSDRYIINRIDEYFSVSDPFPLSNAVVIKHELVQISDPIPQTICVLHGEAEKKDIWGIGRYG